MSDLYSLWFNLLSCAPAPSLMRKLVNEHSQNLKVSVKNNDDIDYIFFYLCFQQGLVQHVPPNVFWNLFARTSHDSQGCTHTHPDWASLSK